MDIVLYSTRLITLNVWSTASTLFHFFMWFLCRAAQALKDSLDLWPWCIIFLHLFCFLPSVLLIITSSFLCSFLPPPLLVPVSLRHLFISHFFSISSYFSENGIKYNLCRIPIAGSDCSTRPYSYDDVEGDLDLVYWALEPEDTNYKVSLSCKAITVLKTLEYHYTITLHLVIIIFHSLSPLCPPDTPDPEGPGSGPWSLAAVWVTLVAPSMDED